VDDGRHLSGDSSSSAMQNRRSTTVQADGQSIMSFFVSKVPFPPRDGCSRTNCGKIDLS